ncbi:adenosylmethionine-8-amino-7-oxononanoate aminotransferase [Lysinibacillus alkalisoli]|uniref:Adenosylmethionine-8-amino-7-oxononanoate aminotransferase n=1 Tax=Lysinibacillus alkalisoli TaxID=1911548 RepID=A0A917D460_9BACI|nr:adenosylmethionine-8-amino-7-oxononanoate aminotransferase [Lysinibacillus alkalisoli]
MMTQLQEKDLRYIWHPCAQMKDYEQFPPKVIVRGEGVWLYDEQGQRYLDAVSSWWVNLFGHANQRLSQVLAQQAQTLEHTIFANFTHLPAIEVAERLVRLTPQGLNKVFFADNGSAAIEVALKMSFQYHAQKNKTRKKRFLALTNAYHGETIGALSVGGVDLYNEVYTPLLLDTVRSQGPDCYRCPFQQQPSHCQAQCIEFVERDLQQHHEEITAVIIEPLIQAAAGMKMYPPIYLKKLRALCTTYDVHLIADEIAVGFGRTGSLFACEQADISPDFLCLSKGITGGYLPLSVVVTTNDVYEAFYDDYQTMKAFLHSHSYTGNTLACRIAQEVLTMFEDENVMDMVQEKGAMLRRQAETAFCDLPYVGEYRQIGLVGAIELVVDKTTKQPFPSEERIGYHIYKEALEKGLLIRPLGNILYFMPPYTITEEEMTFMVTTTKDTLVNFFAERELV